MPAVSMIVANRHCTTPRLEDNQGCGHVLGRIDLMEPDEDRLTDAGSISLVVETEMRPLAEQ